MHNLVLCIRAGALLGLGLVTATPVCRRLVCCTPLSTPLSHRTFLSPPLFSLPSRPPKHRKGEERRERERERRGSRTPRPSGARILPIPPSFPALQWRRFGVPETAMGSGSLLKVFANNFDVLAGSVRALLSQEPSSLSPPLLHLLVLYIRSLERLSGR